MNSATDDKKAPFAEKKSVSQNGTGHSGLQRRRSKMLSFKQTLNVAKIISVVIAILLGFAPWLLVFLNGYSICGFSLPQATIISLIAAGSINNRSHIRAAFDWLYGRDEQARLTDLIIRRMVGK